MIDLKQLKRDADEIIGVALEKGSEIGGAVNWSDLRCICVQRCEDDTGIVEYRIQVEEADPGAIELQSFIFEQLYLRGYGKENYIEISTEW